MSPVPFTGAGQTTLDAGGNGNVIVGPGGMDWVVQVITVSTSSAGIKPQCLIYHGSVSQANLIDGTNSGDGDTSDTVVLLQPGEYITAVWTGGDPKAVAVLRLQGVAWPAGQGVGAL